MSLRNAMSVSVVLFILAAGDLAFAQNWSGDPGVNNPVVTSPANQDYPTSSNAIVDDSGRGHVVVWVDARNGARDIFAQRISVSGNMVWGTNGRAVCTEVYDQYNPRVAVSPSGETFVVWEDARNGTDTDIYVQKIDPTGALLYPAGGALVCGAGGFQSEPDVIVDGSGGCVVTWTDDRAGGDSDIYAVRLDSGGARVAGWTADGVAVTLVTGNQSRPRMINTSVPGECLIVWQDERNGVGNSDICIQRLQSNGSVASAPWVANGLPLCLAAGDQIKPVIARDGAGGAIVAWEDYRNGFDADIYIERISNTGGGYWPTTNGTIINSLVSSNQMSPRIVSDGAGGAIVAWEDDRNGNKDIFAKRLDSTGALATGWGGNGSIVCTDIYDQFAPTITTDDANGCVIAWTDQRNGDDDVYAQRLNAGGSPLWGAGNGIPIGKTGNSQQYPKIARDGLGGAVIVWIDLRGGLDNDIYAQEIQNDGSFPGPTGGWILPATGQIPQKDTVLGNPPGSLNPMGNIVYGEALTAAKFDWGAVGGMTIEADIRIPVLGMAYCSAWIGLDSNTAVDALWANCGFKINSSGGIVLIDFNGSPLTSTSIPGVQTDYHNYRMYIRPSDYRVEYYIDGALIATSAVALNSGSYNNRPVSVGGQSQDGPARIDNVRVKTAGGALLFEETFAVGGAPAAPTLLEQKLSTPMVPLLTGGWTQENKINLYAASLDADAGDLFKIQFEVRPIGTPFSDTFTSETAFSTSNAAELLGVTVTGFSDGEFHWQCRAVDQAGNAGAWVPYGGNADPAGRDFGVDTLFPDTTIASGPPPTGNGSSATIAFNATEANCSFERNLNNTGWVSIASPETLFGLTNGSYIYEVRAVDQAGNADATPAVWSWIVDQAAPSAPTPALDPASDTGLYNFDGVTSDTTPTFTGWSEANATIILYRDGVSVASTTADASGYFIVTATVTPDGFFTFTATATDASANTSSPSFAVWVWIDTIAPPAPTTALDAYSDDGASNSDGITSISNPGFTGSAEPNSLVILYVDGAPLSSTMADGSGLFWVASPPLADGLHSFAATATDMAGFESPPSNTVTVLIESPFPPPTLALDPAGDTGIDNTDGVTSDNTPTFTGWAEVGSTIILFQDGLPVASTVADGSGFFTVTAPAVPDGFHGFAAASLSAGGAAGPPSYDIFLAVDTTPPVAGIVGDGIVDDFDFQNSLTTIEANWVGFSDNAAIANFEWAIGTAPGLTDVQPFTPIGIINVGINSGLALTPGQTYFVTVRAVDYVGLTATATSDGVQVGTLDAPANLSAVVGDGQISLSWDPVVGAAYYYVYYGTVDGASTDAAVATTGNALVLTGLANRVTYYVVVTAATESDMEGPESDVIFATPGATGPLFERWLPGGSAADGYRMISMPLISSDPMGNLTDDLGAYDPTQWRMFTFDPATGSYLEVGMPGFPAPLPGRAYWIISLAGGPIDIEGTPVDASQDFVITLQPGWNMVGHPFIFPVDWADATANGVPIGDPGENGFISENLWDWVGGYVAAPQLVPSRGYWIRNRTASPVELRIPPSPASLGLIGPNAKPLAAPIMDLRTTGDDLPPPPPGAQSSASSGGGGGGGGGGCSIATADDGSSENPLPTILLIFASLLAGLIRTVSGASRQSR